MRAQATQAMQAGVICYDLDAFIADCLSRVSRECEDSGVSLKAYPVLARVAADRVDFPYERSQLSGRFFTVSKGEATPEGLTSTVNWTAAWRCVSESRVVVLLGIQAGTAVLAAILATLLRRRLISVNQTLPPSWEFKRVWWVRWLKGWVLGRCSLHIVQTPITRATLKQVYRISETKMVDAPFEAGAGIFAALIDSVREDRDRLRAKFGWGDEAVFLFVGTLLRFKGALTLIEAARRLAGTNSRFRVVFIGGVAGSLDEPRLSEYEAAVSKAGIEGIVEFAGRFPHQELAAAYIASDAVVLPTERDMWPKVLVEAALAGQPLITTSACGAAGSLVQDGVTGYVVPPGDPAALADAMRKLLDPSLRSVLGQRAKAYIQRFCDPTAEAVGFRVAILRALERTDHTLVTKSRSRAGRR